MYVLLCKLVGIEVSWEYCCTDTCVILANIEISVVTSIIVSSAGTLSSEAWSVTWAFVSTCTLQYPYMLETFLILILDIWYLPNMAPHLCHRKVHDHNRHHKHIPPGFLHISGRGNDSVWKYFVNFCTTNVKLLFVECESLIIYFHLNYCHYQLYKRPIFLKVHF